MAAEGAIERARAAGFSALVVTIDTPVAGMRERDSRNGVKELLSGSLLAKARFLPEIVRHPGWLAGFLRDGGVPKLPNVVILGRGQYRSSTSARLWQPPRSVGKTYVGSAIVGSARLW